MGFLAGDGFLGENNEMTSISGDQTPALPPGVGKLFSVGHLDVSHVVSADCVEPPIAEAFSDSWRKVFVQIELHAMRTTPGSLAATVSQVSAAFSSISGSIS